jgi:hypothetical protein
MNHDEDRIDELLRRSFEGPVADDGFAGRVMLAVPGRRRRVAWPTLVGVAAGIAVTWASLATSLSPSLSSQQWFGGGASFVIAGMAGAAVLSLLACWWGLSEGSRQ